MHAIRPLKYRGGNMRIKSFAIQSFIFALVLILASSSSFAVVEKQQEQSSEVIIIPPEIKSVIVEGIQTRQPRLDIPFTIFKNYYFPQQNYLHSVFFLKIKNSDLGFAPPSEGIDLGEKKKEKEEETQSIFESTPTKLQASAHIFLQFNQLDGEFEQEIYIPVKMEIDGALYEADKEEMYSTGYPLLPGKYLLSIAIASPELQRIGTQYIEFTLPNNDPTAPELIVSPVLFAKKLEQTAAQETRTLLHKGYFTYAILKIEPNLDHIFSPGDLLDVFFIILCSQPNEVGEFDIEVNYEVVRGEETIIRYASTNYKSPLISQPLPSKRTTVIKSEAGEKRETKNLEAGTYSLTIDIKDKISGKTLKTKVDFEVKG